MKLPTKLDKSTLDLATIAEQLVVGRLCNTTDANKMEDLLSTGDDWYIFDAAEPGFEDWDEEDYARNTSEDAHHHQPYAFITPMYVVVHDYC